jgi:uncharacterized protein (DUF2249 family)
MSDRPISHPAAAAEKQDGAQPPSAARGVVREIRASDIDASVRHQTIVGAIEALEQGDAVRLHVDHEPKPLYYMLQAERPGQVSWEPEKSGPNEWVVVVRRIAGRAG